MDIAKYIGLFLLKNQFCYIHGLGNLELKKVQAAHDSKSVSAAAYEVVVSPAGSIDDNLANFIATNEQISISKAANALREFSMQARKDMGEGKEVPIPNIGKFVEDRGRVAFITDPHFKHTPASIPTVKNSKQLDAQNATPNYKPSYPAPTRADSINWGTVILVVVLLALLGGGGYAIYYYMQQNKKVDTTAVVEPAPVPAATVAAAPDTTIKMPQDSTQMDPPAEDSTTVHAFNWVIGSYRTKMRADKRVETLALSNVKSEVIQQDSLHYLVVTSVTSRNADTAHVKDSLARFYGFKEVAIRP